MKRMKIYEILIGLFLRITQGFKRILVFNTPCYPNMGDHAITKAEFKFLNRYFPTVVKIEMDEYLWNRKKEQWSKFITVKDIIMINGGGYLGDLWPEPEQIAMSIIKMFPNNKVIYFPQTCYYSEGSIDLLEANRAFYLEYKNVDFMLRDKRSLEFINNEFLKTENRGRLYPDMVGLLTNNTNIARNNIILLCLRSDHEKVVDITLEQKVKKAAEKLNLVVCRTDTVGEGFVAPYERNEKLADKLHEFSCSRMVVTDRLHGMLFAAITGTPCIALDNKSKKVSGVYEWISYLNYIKCIDSLDDFEAAIDELVLLKNCTYDNQPLIENFNDMAKYIREYL